MKKLLRISFVAILSTFFIFSFQGCLKDSCKNTYTIYTPVYKTLTQARADMKTGTSQPLSNTGKIYVYGNYIFLNELYKGIHIIDNTNPISPKNIGFLNIPGNVDLAVKGSYLYADSYSDIVVFDISNPLHAKPAQFLNNVLKEGYSFWGNQTNTDSVLVLAGYTERDTTVDCETYTRWNNCTDCMYSNAGGQFFTSERAMFSNTAPTGVGGSMARFTIANNYLYAVTGSQLYSFDLADPSRPNQRSTKNLGWGIETIYPFQNKLFIGSNSGMFIYDITNPSDPVVQGQFTHAVSCDPVITDGQYAYVTLRSGTRCQGLSNQLDVINISNLNSPSLLKTYPMTNPYGLSKDGATLFICDGKDGLKVYDAGNPSDIKLSKQLPGMETYDVIAQNGLAIVVAKDGLYQYNYTSPSAVSFLSKIAISK